MLRQLIKSLRLRCTAHGVGFKPINRHKEGTTRRTEMQHTNASLVNKAQHDGEKQWVQHIVIWVIKDINRGAARPSLGQELPGRACFFREGIQFLTIVRTL